jgi:hypothetical protein
VVSSAPLSPPLFCQFESLTNQIELVRILPNQIRTQHISSKSSFDFEPIRKFTNSNSNLGKFDLVRFVCSPATG